MLKSLFLTGEAFFMGQSASKLEKSHNLIIFDNSAPTPPDSILDPLEDHASDRYDRTWIILLAAVVIPRLISIYCFYLYDDAFITFRYATNLVNGLGFTYNPGERVQGTTSPLWAMLLAIPYQLGLGIELSSRVLGLLADAAALTAALWALRRENLAAAAVWCGFLFAVDLYLAKIAVGGMESSLFLLCSVSAAYLTLTNRKSAAAVLAACSVFLRPEALLFALCLIGFVWYEEKRFPWRSALVGAAVIVAGVGLQWAYFGDLIPQSVRGKMGLARTYSGLCKLVLFPAKDPLQALMTVTSLISLPYALRVSRFVRLYGLWTLVLFCAWLISGAHLWMWYCVPIFFIKTVITGLGIARYIPQIVRWVRPWIALIAVAAAWIALALIIGPDPVERHVYHRIRQWAADKDFSGQSAYGMDFGAIGFYTDLRILDEPGLVWPRSITRYYTDPKAILLGEKPEWAFVTCYDGNIEMMRSPELEMLYEPVERFSETGNTDLWPEPEHVSADWVKDFILYRRR
jgi:hypothetical protein